MTLKRIFILSFFFITVPCLAQEQNDYLLSAKETYSDSNQVTNGKMETNQSNPIAFGWFIQDVRFVDFYFKQKEFYFTPGLASGFSISYKNSFGAIGAFIIDGNFTGYYFDAAHTLHVKKLDEHWIGLTVLIGEIAYQPAQQSYEALWLYSAGLAYAFVYPMQWGSLSISLMADGAYANKEVNLNTRLMLQLDVPIF